MVVLQTLKKCGLSLDKKHDKDVCIIAGAQLTVQMCTSVSYMSQNIQLEDVKYTC